MIKTAQISGKAIRPPGNVDYAEALSIAEELMVLREQSLSQRTGMKIEPALKSKIGSRIAYLDYLLYDASEFSEKPTTSTQQEVASELLTDFGYDVDNPPPPSKIQRIINQLFAAAESRRDYLISKHAYLKRIQLSPRKKSEDDAGESRSAIRKLFDIAKKVVDILDDIWALLRGALPVAIFNAVGPFLTGGVGFIIHLAELHQAVKEGKKASEAKQMSQRRARVISSLFISGFALTGLILSAALLATGFGYPVFAAFGSATFISLILTPVITGLLLSIYTVELIKRGYLLHSAIKNETIHRKAVYDQNYINNLLVKVKNAAPLSKKELYLIQRYQKEYPYNPKALCKEYIEQRLLAERNVAFGFVEVAASALVTVGTTLSTITALSALTMGALPMALLIAGVVSGIACKFIDRQDEKRNFAWTRSIRAWIVGHDPLQSLENKEPHQVSTHARAAIKLPLSDTPAKAEPFANQIKHTYSIIGGPALGALGKPGVSYFVTPPVSTPPPLDVTVSLSPSAQAAG